MILKARQLQEKCQKQNKDLNMTFVDLTKAFDTVIRDWLWNLMAKISCPPIFIAMVQQFACHDDMQVRVQNNGEYSEPFSVTYGVKQDCVIAPTLYSIMFLPCSHMLFRTVMLVSLSETDLITSYVT